MKHKILSCQKFGFSLVELLISLIVISCITAAFTPLITKKFATNIGFNGGSGGIKSDCKVFGINCTLCTNDYCISCPSLLCNEDEYIDEKTCSCKKCSEKFGNECTLCNSNTCLSCPEGQYRNSDGACISCSTRFNNCAVCTIEKCTKCDSHYMLEGNECKIFDCPSPDFMQIGDLCVTAKNMGDSFTLKIPETIMNVQVGTQCDSSSEKCCWRGSTAGANCNDNNGGYSGCNRTLCNWSAADEICKSFNYAGLNWRLATTIEMDSWGNNSINKGSNGLQLCDYYSTVTSSAFCNYTFSCFGTFDNQCHPNDVWASGLSGTKANCYGLGNDSWYACSDYTNSARSVRCVTENSSNCKSKFGQYCKSCSSSSCVTCSNTCSSDEYIDESNNCSCKKCKDKFGAGCTSCNTKQCLGCKGGYALTDNPSSNNACISDFTCSGPNFMQIGNLCITRKNMGDGSILTIPSDVTITAGQCNPDDNKKCCWRKNADCDNENGGGYSGCSRTVCDWKAADYICKSFNYKGMTWRLPKVDEMLEWPDYSMNLGTEGLQLCDSYSGYSSAWCGQRTCSHGFFMDVACHYSGVWTSTPGTKIDYYYYYYLKTGKWTNEAANYYYGTSFRCVTEM